MKSKIIKEIKAYACIVLSALCLAFYIYLVASFVQITSHNMTDQEYSKNNFFIVMREVFTNE